MQDLHWECRTCEACGVCARTEEQCEIYTEYYGVGESQAAEQQMSASTIAYQSVTAPTLTTNRGLINWLTGQIVKVVRCDTMVQLTIQVGENYISSIIPVKDFEAAGKNEGDTVTTVFKAANVKIML